MHQCMWVHENFIFNCILIQVHKKFRLNKAPFTCVLSVLEGKAAPSCSSSIAIPHRLTYVLRFLAEGGYQHGLGNNYDIPMTQSTFYWVLNNNLSDDEKSTLQFEIEWIMADFTPKKKNCPEQLQDLKQRHGTKIPIKIFLKNNFTKNYNIPKMLYLYLEIKKRGEREKLYLLFYH